MYGGVTITEDVSRKEAEQQQWKDLQTLVVKMNTRLSIKIEEVEKQQSDGLKLLSALQQDLLISESLLLLKDSDESVRNAAIQRLSSSHLFLNT